MEIKRLDASPYLTDGEVVKYKTSAKRSKLSTVQLVLCWLFALIVLAGDSFLLAMTYALNEQVSNVNTFLMPLEIALIVMHLLPFVFWIGNVFVFSKNKGDKWYALTNKRVLILQGVKPVNVTFINISEISSFKVGKSSLTLLLGEEAVSLNGIANPKEMGDKLMELFGDAKSEVNVKPVEPKKEEPVKPIVEEPTGAPEVVIADVGFTAENGVAEEPVGAVENSAVEEPAVEAEENTSEAQEVEAEVQENTTEAQEVVVDAQETTVEAQEVVVDGQETAVEAQEVNSSDFTAEEQVTAEEQDATAEEQEVVSSGEPLKEDSNTDKDNK